MALHIISIDATVTKLLFKSNFDEVNRYISRYNLFRNKIKI